MKLIKNKILEKHKKQVAVKLGFKSWNDLRAHREMKDCFILLHEACENAINEISKFYEDKINRIGIDRKKVKSKSLQDEMLRFFPKEK